LLAPGATVFFAFIDDEREFAEGALETLGADAVLDGFWPSAFPLHSAVPRGGGSSLCVMGSRLGIFILPFKRLDRTWISVAITRIIRCVGHLRVHESRGHRLARWLVRVGRIGVAGVHPRRIHVVLRVRMVL